MCRKDVAELLSEMKDLSQKAALIIPDTLTATIYPRIDFHEEAAYKALVKRVQTIANMLLASDDG